MENTAYSDELQHWGIKGMKWGVRRYQNPDGSLTAKGQKRYSNPDGTLNEKGKKLYNKEMEKLKAEKAKVKAEEKNAANRKKTQAKFDKLEAEKQKLEERKKALKEGKSGDDDQPAETPEQRRERLLKSTDPKELYEGKDDLTYNEISERINRMDIEAKLQGRIPQEHQKTGMEYMDSLKEKIDKATAMYKSVDSAYSTVANSAIGKSIAKQLGISLPDEKKHFTINDANDFYKNITKKSPAELKEASEALKNYSSYMDKYNEMKNKQKADADYAKKEAYEKKAAEARKKEAEKNVENDNAAAKRAADDAKAEARAKKRVAKEEAEAAAKRTAERKAKWGYNDTGEKSGEKESYSDGKVYGEGTSKSSIKDQMDNGKKWWDTSNVSETIWPDSDNYINNLSRTANNLLEGPVGQSNVVGLLEDRS